MGVVDKLVDFKKKLVLNPNIIIISCSGIIAAGGVGLLQSYGIRGGKAAVGPTFSTLVNFFLPLLLSTAFFLAAVVLLFKISPPPASDSVGDLAGEELMDYVAGATVGYQRHQTHHHQQLYSSDREESSEKQQTEPQAAEE